MKKFKPTYRNMLFLITAVSFAVILLLLVFFTGYAPGNYDIDGSNGGSKTALDIIFAIALLINEICVFLSLIAFFKTCSTTCRKRKINLKECGIIVLEIYPIILLLLLCGWNFSTLCNYLLSPFKMLLTI